MESLSRQCVIPPPCLIIYGLVLTLTVDLLTSKSNQFIFVFKCT